MDKPEIDYCVMCKHVIVGITNVKETYRCDKFRDTITQVSTPCTKVRVGNTCPAYESDYD